jgi:integrase
MKDVDKLTQIMLVTTINKQRIRIYTKIRIEPKYWDKKSCRCRADFPVNLRERKKLILVNKQLDEIESSVYQTDEKLAEKGKFLTQQIVRKTIADNQSATKGGFRPIVYLHQLVEEYLNNLNKNGKRGIASTQRTYHTALKRLEAFCQQHPIRTFEDFDNKFFTSFANYLYSCTYQKGKTKKQYTQNTVINTIKVIKNLLHRAYDNEMTNNNYFTKVQTLLSSDVSEQIYLNEKEIKRLAEMKLTLPHEVKIRDMFIIACWTALRISDIQKLHNAEIHQDHIALYQTKTNERVEIPILKEVAPLIAHYQKVGFPSIHICKANETIKELAKRCGINDNINQKEHRGGTTHIQTLPKWSLVSFHTARRSCITNLYKRGYPVNYIMTLSGHRSVQAFQRYMRASSKELLNSFMKLLKKDGAL